MALKIIELDIEAALSADTRVEEVAWVELPAIETEFMYFQKQGLSCKVIDTENFVEKQAGESKDDYIARCIPFLINEGYPEDQAAAICYESFEGCGCGQDFDINTSGLPPFVDYADDEMLVKAVGVVDGIPVFSTIQDAEEYAKHLNCEGHHSHTLMDGSEVYMACSEHPEDFSGWDAEDLELKEAFDVIFSSPQDFDFGLVTNTLLQGYTVEQIAKFNHKNPTKYYKYKRVITTAAEDREFCNQLEGKFFRRGQIYALDKYNNEFGHKKQEYSKWLYKGGPNCFHGWEEWSAVRNKIRNDGMVPGLPGTPPKQMPNNGYYNAETKRASEIAYIISQKSNRQVSFTRGSSSVIIVDVDGTLVDGITPNQKVIDYVNEKWKNHKIVVITGRKKGREGETSRELDRWGIRYDDLYLNGTNKDTPFYKYDVAQKLLNEGYNVVEAIDNDEANRTQYRRLGIKVSSPSSFKAQFKAVEDKRMLYSPLMMPGILIPRIDEMSGEQYFVRFTKEAVERIQQKFMMEMRLNKTNMEHGSEKFSDAVMVESWIVNGKQDKAFSLGYTEREITDGTWMVGYKILDTDEGDKLWNEFIKTGKVRGLSAEGSFLMNFGQQKSDDYLLMEIINILKKLD